MSDPCETCDQWRKLESATRLKWGEARLKAIEDAARIAESWAFDPNAPAEWRQPMKLVANAIAKCIRELKDGGP
jgi:hypothetical protein